MKPPIQIRAALSAALVLVAAAAPGHAAGAARYRGAQGALRFDVSPPLAALEAKRSKDSGLVGGLLAEPEAAPEAPRGGFVADPLTQDWLGALAIPAPSASFDGPSFLDSGVGTYAPPDPSGDVGPDRYVVMTNFVFSVYSKSGTKLYGPVPNNTLWAGFGGPCEAENAGQPIVLYDQFADRWLLTQHTAAASPPHYLCLALSVTGDPLGSYYRWAFPTAHPDTPGTNIADDPKYGLWGDGYYLGTRERLGAVFQGAGVYAFDRAAMLGGASAPVAISFLVPPSDPPFEVGDGLLPADVDGATPPPAGAPAPFIGALDDALSSADALTLWRFHADFAVPGDSSFAWTATLPLSAFDTDFGTPAFVPQPGTATLLDTGAYRHRPLSRVVYRNFGDHQALVGNFTVEGAPEMAGIRWWELRDPSGTPTLFQEGTYAPGATDTIHRWMGAVALDVEGNLALGYSASNGSVFPGIRYTGRLAGDEAGTLPQGEGVLWEGLFAQTASSLWGTYSSMSVDPADDCSFWYANEYLPSSVPANWRLRIGKFQFAECDAPDFTIGLAPSAQAICAGAPAAWTVDLDALRGFAGEVTLALSGEPDGTTPGFTPAALSPPGASALALADTELAAPGTYLLRATGSAGALAHAAEAALRVDAALAAAPTLLAPANHAIAQPLAPTLTWSAVAGAAAYRLQVDDQSNFASPLLDVVQSGTSRVVYGLAALTPYFWRVAALNACGELAAAAFDFTTAAPYCRAPGVAIPDGPGAGVDDALAISSDRAILDLDVTVKITHPWVGDLKVTLKHDSGTPVVLIDRPGYTGSGFGCGKPNIDVRVNDEGTDGAIETTCNASAPAIPGNRVGGDPPSTSLLAQFDGPLLGGTWTLNAADLLSGDNGTLVEWCLVPTLDPMPFADGFETGDTSRWSQTVQ